eukprot:IDg2340t1
MARSIVFLALLVLSTVSTLSEAAILSSSQCAPATLCLDEMSKGRACPLLPVPPESLAPPPSASGYLLKKVRPGVWSFYEGNYMVLI